MAVAVLAGCTPTPSTGPAGAGAAGTPAPAPSAARVLFAPGDPQQGVSPDAALRVVAAGGRLQTVSVKSADGSTLNGTLSADGAVWRSSPARLPFGSTYTAVATAVDAQGRPTTATSSFRVRNATLLKASFPLYDGSTVGVGMPVILHFNHTPSDPAAVERALSVQSTPAVVGGWGWVSPREIHWRPKTYWPSGAKVTVRVSLKDVQVGNNQWGASSFSSSFNIGTATVMKVGINTHELQVTQNGAVIRTIPVTTGKAGFLTRNGVKVIMSKQRSVIMDSTTVDIPKGSPNAYRLKVEYAMRMTYSGEFLHAAPWSVGSQGVANVSHGCTGMSLSNAAWLYSIAKTGDVVEYTGSPRPMTLGNGYGDWNLSWSQWQKLSALSA
jgi:lipoprotein-anchoring transpeptidase ErfK/SrfK